MREQKASVSTVHHGTTSPPIQRPGCCSHNWSAAACGFSHHRGLTNHTIHCLHQRVLPPSTQQQM
ncbi:hypothetical protein E2C01_099967 [Portunus trituberculatus]|uniref:Uncharacterized protein n=1 Tax=Portunus trituberculatus TaxID=210409 RepID=A0A5B7KG78_PORTR|nr:hypothetical protein [Portunus trituberculatus]